MDTKNLISFMTVYECGSIAKAAERLFISPQGLSKSIAHLEGELGESLFVRTNRGITPTPFATSLYPKARKIAAIMESIETDRDSAANSVISVASTSGFLFSMGTAFREAFAKAYPNVRLEIEEGNDQHVAELVASGIAECACVSGPVDYARFDASPVSRHPHVAIVNRADELATRDRLDYADFQGRRIAIMGPGFSPYNYIQNRFVRAGVVLGEVVGVAEVSTGRILASRGEAVCITVDFAATGVEDQGCVAIPFFDPNFTWDTYLIHSKGADLSDEARAFEQFFKDWFARHGVEFFGV